MQRETDSSMVYFYQKALVLGEFSCAVLFHHYWTLTPHSYGTAKSGVGISAMSVLRPDLMMKCVVPVIMAGIIAVSHLSPQLDVVRTTPRAILPRN